MFNNIRQSIRNFKPSIRLKILLSLGAIGVMLLVSSIIVILEYSRMSNYVSELIAGNIRSIEQTQKLASVVDSYNLQLLTVIGDSTINAVPNFDMELFTATCDSLGKKLQESGQAEITDTVLVTCREYISTSAKIDSVILSNFINSRTWYFEHLQPIYSELNIYIEKLGIGICSELQKNSATFDRGFYRSTIPGAVAIVSGLLIVLLLMFFITVYYVNPLYRMLKGLKEYKLSNKSYSVDFDGDDQLKELNNDILDITLENSQLRKRIKSLREKLNSN